MKADAPLIIDANAELALSSAFKRFEPIAGRGLQIDQPSRVVEHA
jgi:hypothetical protein